jgi:hypothetical protein
MWHVVTSPRPRPGSIWTSTLAYMTNIAAVGRLLHYARPAQQTDEPTQCTTVQPRTAPF